MSPTFKLVTIEDIQPAKMETLLKEKELPAEDITIIEQNVID